MFSKAINGDNDIYIVNGKFFNVSDKEEVAQLCTTRLRTFLGEWFLNTNIGTNYFGVVFVTPIDLESIDSEFRSIILNTQGVKELTSYQSTIDSSTRTLTVEFTANSIYGDIDINESINI